jgi:hypothetical protein
VITAYSRFMVTECPRCGDLVLTGRAAGLTWRVDTRTVPATDATVLRRYGVSVLALDRRLSGMHADFWDPGTHDLAANRYLVVPHVCEALHARRTL